MSTNTTRIAQGRHLTLVQQDGWEFVTRERTTGVVTIVAITDDDALILVEQYRAPIGRSSIELPAGLSGDDPGAPGEALLDAARRELLEETGFTAGTWTPLGDFVSSAGLTDETVTFFRASNLTRVSDGGGVENERIRVHLVPRTELDAWIKAHRAEGTAIDAKVYAALALSTTGRMHSK